MPAEHVLSPILSHATESPNHPAFLFQDQTLTYGKLVDSGRRIASLLLESGITKGDRIAVISPNRPEFFSIYFGIAFVGACIVPISPEYTADEIQYILECSGARLVIRSNDVDDPVARAALHMRPAPTTQDLEQLLLGADSTAPYSGTPLGSGDDLVLLCYTSGTTSKPKGVAATHANELASGKAYSSMWAISQTDRVLVTLPLAFSFGFHAATYVALLSGATVLLATKFHPERALDAIERLQATILLGVPTMYAMMAEFAKKSLRHYDVSSLRVVAASGATVNNQLIADCSNYLGFTVRPYYALTEVRPIFSFDLRRQERPPTGSVGRLIAPTEVRLVDDEGCDVADGQVGEIWARGPSFSGAYYEDPQRTTDTVTTGWFRTGDLASRDDGGNYFIVGRMRDQIISGGAKIAPVEVEEALLSHPGIAAAAVLGSPDPIFGQLVKAVIVKADATLNEKDIITFCESRIASYKVPRIVTFMDALPVAPSGKIIKSALV